MMQKILIKSKVRIKVSTKFGKAKCGLLGKTKKIISHTTAETLVCIAKIAKDRVSSERDGILSMNKSTALHSA